MERGGQREFTLTFKRDRKPILVLQCDKHSTFQCDEDVVYFANANEGAGGAWIEAYSLVSGRLLWMWQTRKIGGGNGHFAYANRVDLELIPNGILVFGRETYGDHIEMFHRGTGLPLAHKVYRTGGCYDVDQD